MIEITEFNVADYLDDKDVVLEYLRLAMEDGSEVFLTALGDVEKAVQKWPAI